MKLLFPEDRDTHEIFRRFQSKVHDAASLFQTNHVVHRNAPREDEDIFLVWVSCGLFRLVMFIHNVYLQELNKAYRAFCLP